MLTMSCVLRFRLLISRSRCPEVWRCCCGGGDGVSPAARTVLLLFPSAWFRPAEVFLWGRGLCRGENGGVVAEGWCVVCGVWLVVWLVVDDALGGE